MAITSVHSQGAHRKTKEEQAVSRVLDASVDWAILRALVSCLKSSQKFGDDSIDEHAVYQQRNSEQSHSKSARGSIL